MAYVNNVRDGRQSKVFLLKFETTEVSTITKGKIYAVKAKASSSSVLEDLKVGDFFIATSEITLASGDKVEAVTPLFLGGATDKDLSFEKSTTDITCDKDKDSNSVTDGKVASSGSITMYDLLDDDMDSAVNLIRSRFNKVVTYNANGKPSVLDGDKTTKDVLMFLWDARDLDEGETVGIDFVPALLSSQGHASAYGSGQTMPVNFTGNDSDELGHKRSYHQFAYFSEFGEAMGL